VRKSVLLGVPVAIVAMLALVAGGYAAADKQAAPKGPQAKGQLRGCSGVFYQGAGRPQYIIVSDLPMQGANRPQTVQMTEAIRFVLRQRKFRAGRFTIGYQVCDDSTAQRGAWDTAKCTANARAYAADRKVIGVIGTFNSGCAKLEIPILNRAPGGPVAMVSPANTATGLTVSGLGAEKGEPRIYYPTGKRNYARVVTRDDIQGPAGAMWAVQQLKKKSIYILTDRETYGLGVAKTFQSAARKLGARTFGPEAWDPKASSYEALFRKIGGTGADAVFLGGLIDENGAQVIKDKVAVLGPNNGRVKLLAPDGFTTQQTIDEAGKAAAGMFMSVAGVPIDQFKGQGAEFASEFKPTLGGKEIDPYAIYGAQAAQVLLDAIADSDGSREQVIENLFNTKVENGYLGNFEINENGDPSGAAGAVVGFTIYRAEKELVPETTLSPKQAVVNAARGGGTVPGGTETESTETS